MHRLGYLLLFRGWFVRLINIHAVPRYRIQHLCGYNNHCSILAHRCIHSQKSVKKSLALRFCERSAWFMPVLRRKIRSKLGNSTWWREKLGSSNLIANTDLLLAAMKIVLLWPAGDLRLSPMNLNFNLNMRHGFNLWVQSKNRYRIQIRLLLDLIVHQRKFDFLA
jgi:hypothetical protein